MSKKTNDNLSKNFLFTQNVALDYMSKQYRGNTHLICVGGSGSGKSFHFVKPNLLQANGCSFVVTDPKGELLNDMGRYLEKQGYKVKILNIDDMAHSCCYNPFEYIRGDDDVTDMVQVFMENTNGDAKLKGDFWDSMSMIQLEALCFLVRATYPKDRQNWYEVAALLRQAIPEKDEDGLPIPTKCDELFEELNRKEEGHIAYLKWMDFKSIAKNDETVANAVGSTIARITRFSNQNIRKLTSIDTVHLEEIGLEKTALFCLTKAANSTYNFIMGMCYMQLFQTLEAVAKQNGGKLPIYTRFLLDEFANICKIPKFDEWLSYIRSFGVSISIMIQTYAQLEKLYDKAADIITGNCDFTLFLGTTDEKVAKKISERLGKTTIYRKEHVKGNQYKRVPMQRDLMTTNEVLAMKTNECILLCARKQPIFDKKIQTNKLPNWKYCYGGSHKKEDWFDPNDFPSVDSQYEELKARLKAQKEEEDKKKEETKKPIENIEDIKVKEEPKVETPKKKLTNDLEDIIQNRDITPDEDRIASLPSSNPSILTNVDTAKYIETEFSNKKEMESNIFVVSTYSENLDYEYSSNTFDIQNLLNNFLSNDSKKDNSISNETPVDDTPQIEEDNSFISDLPMEETYVEDEPYVMEESYVDDGFYDDMSGFGDDFAPGEPDIDEADIEEPYFDEMDIPDDTNF